MKYNQPPYWSNLPFVRHCVVVAVTQSASILPAPTLPCLQKPLFSLPLWIQPFLDSIYERIVCICLSEPDLLRFPESYSVLSMLPWFLKGQDDSTSFYGWMSNIHICFSVSIHPSADTLVNSYSGYCELCGNKHGIVGVCLTYWFFFFFFGEGSM